jgi:hypothetical protein
MKAKYTGSGVGEVYSNDNKLMAKQGIVYDEWGRVLERKPDGVGNWLVDKAEAYWLKKLDEEDREIHKRGNRGNDERHSDYIYNVLKNDAAHQAIKAMPDKKVRHEFYWAPSLETIHTAEKCRLKGNPIEWVKKVKEVFDKEPQPKDKPHQRALWLSGNLTEIIEGRLHDRHDVDHIIYSCIAVAWVVNKTEIGMPW